MEVEKTIQSLAHDVGLMRKELGRTQVQMREVLDRLRDRPHRSAVDSGSASAKSSVDRTGKGKGLTLSREDLGRLLRSARAAIGDVSGADSRGIGKAALRLDGLARAVREARAGSDRAADAAEEEAEEVTMPLGELAEILKGPAASEAGAEVGRQRPAGDSPEKASSRPPTREPATRRPFPFGAARTGRTRARPSPKTSSFPEASLIGGDKLDVNMMTSLTRWAGSVKCRFGLTGLWLVIEVYRLSGHLRPFVEKTIYGLATLSILPDESDYHTVTQDDLADALLALHGIIYGSGRAPVGPSVDFDPTVWATIEDAVAEDGAWESAGPLREEDGAGTTEEAGQIDPDRPDPVSEHAGTDEDVIGDSRSPSSRAFDEALSHYREATIGRRGGPRGGGRKAPAEFGQDRYEGATFDAEAPPSDDQPVADRVQTWSTNGGSTDIGAVATRQAYSSDLTDSEWRVVGPMVPQVKPGGRPGKYERREILNGILYQVRTGCSWRSLPQDLPPWKIVHHYYRTWRIDGTWQPIESALFSQSYDFEPLNGDGAWAGEPEPVASAGDVGAEEAGPAMAVGVAGS